MMVVSQACGCVLGCGRQCESLPREINGTWQCRAQPIDAQFFGAIAGDKLRQRAILRATNSDLRLVRGADCSD